MLDRAALDSGNSFGDRQRLWVVLKKRSLAVGVASLSGGRQRSSAAVSRYHTGLRVETRPTTFQ